MTATTTETPAPAAEAVKPRSGGPKTQAGKDSARRNALKHGLRARVVFPADVAALIDERTGVLRRQYQPKTLHETWLIDQVAVNSVLIDRCAALSIADLGRRVDRAALCWDDDRRLDAETLGAKLSRDPGRTLAALRQTRQGADWLIDRWTGLGDALALNGQWDDDQQALALDLLGTPRELRNANRLVRPDSSPDALSSLVADQVQALRARQLDALDDLDAEDRELAQLGAPADDAQTHRIRRYEAECRRSVRWAMAEFDRVRHGLAPSTASLASPEIEIEPEPEPDDDPAVFLTSMLARLAASIAQSETAEAETNAPEFAAEPEPDSEIEPSAAAPTLSRRARKAKEKQARLNARRAAKGR